MATKQGLKKSAVPKGAARAQGSGGQKTTPPRPLKGRGGIAADLTALIGRTPLTFLPSYSKALGLKAKLVAKLESFNPMGSLKDRIALAMIEKGERAGQLDRDTVIVEPTSGNTGLGLALVAASRGYRLVLTMPESMSLERRKLLVALGAELVLTPAGAGMRGAVSKSIEIAARFKKSFIPGQFSNPVNPEIHRLTTAEEIWSDTKGAVDILVAGVGTGGTISGVGRRLKELKPSVRVVAVEPFESAVLSGAPAGAHGIQGIGPGFVPEVLDLEVIDEIFQVRTKEAFRTARLLARSEGLVVGASSGAAAFVAAAESKKAENQGRLVVVILPDTGERYLSTALYESTIDDLVFGE
jgi:cysteine synthase A